MRKTGLALLIAALGAITNTYGQTNATIQALVANGYSQSDLPAGDIYHNYARGCFLLTATELSALISTNITSFGFILETGTGSADVNGTMTLYLENTSDINYSKSATYTTVITGMTNVYSAGMLIPAAYNSQTLTLSLPANFNYTGGGLYVAYNWVAASPVSGTAHADYFTSYAATNMAGYTSATTNNANTLAHLTASVRRPVCLIGDVNEATNEAGVLTINAPGRVAEALHTGHVITADIINSGINALTNVNVTLNVTGANNFSNTQIIPTIAPGDVETVMFAAFNPVTLGTNNISVSLPADQYSANNQATATQEVSCNVLCNGPAITYTTGYGETNLGTICLSRFSFIHPTSLTGIDCGLVADYTPNISITGVLLDAGGTILATTNTLAVTQAMFNTTQSLTFATTQALAGGDDYYTGILESTGYIVGALKSNVPANTFFYSETDGSGLTEVYDYAFDVRPVIEGLNINIANAGTTLCKGHEVNLVASGANTYSWTSSVFNPVENPNDADILVSPTSNEIYTVTANDAAGCKGEASAAIAVSPCTGLNNSLANDGLRIYPNPAINGKTQIAGLNGTTTITVYNLLGAVVWVKTVTDEETSIDLSNQPFGNYLIKISGTNGASKTVKIVNAE